jgi:four helix bundle protein
LRLEDVARKGRLGNEYVSARNDAKINPKGQIVSDFKSLDVWKRAHQLTLDIYALTASFPKSELFGLTSQLRRAGASVAANIAEGCGRRGDGELVRFLRIASGSNSELEYHLLLARDLRYITHDQHVKLNGSVARVGKLLTALIGRLEQSGSAKRRSVAYHD